MRGAVVKAEAAALRAMLPPGFVLAGAAELTFVFTYMTNIAWLGGRGYNTLSVTMDTLYSGPGGPARGPLMLVLWENMCDPIITGREQLGIAKIPCELPEPTVSGTSIRCDAAWCGFKFLELTIDDIVDGAPPAPLDPEPGERGGVAHLRYLPRIGLTGGAAVAEAVLTPNSETGTDIIRTQIGRGSISISQTRWEDMPTQVHIIEALREAITGEVVSTFLIDAVGAGDLGGQILLGPVAVDGVGRD